MNTFNWLLIAHLVGDWLLQNDWMARGKRRAFVTLAGLLHYGMYTAVVLGAFWLSGWRRQSIVWHLALGAAVFISHWLIDAGDVPRRWMRFYRQSELDMVRVMVDQTLHLLVLASIALFSSKM